MLHRGKWRHNYPCTQLCAHNSDRTEHVSLLTVLPRALSSVPAFLAARKNVSFHRLLSNFSGLDLVLICTVSEVHMLLLEQLGEGLGGGFFCCLGLLLVLFIILHSLGFGYLKFCCKLPLLFLVANKKENLNVNQKHHRQCLACLTPCMVCLKGGREWLHCNYQTLASFVFCFPQLLKCNF